MKNLGEINPTHPGITPDYKNWGLGIDNQALIGENYQCVSVKLVKFDETRDAYLLRFQLDSSLNLNSQHISVLLESKSFMLLGLNKMVKGSSDALPTHQEALNSAIKFMNNMAPDLISEASECFLTETSSDHRLEFSPVVKLENLELNWIDQHKETITFENAALDIIGMKVKFYIPSKDRWGWVIVDSNNQVITFERDIWWDFENYKRLSPMYLHDKWLEVQGI